MTTYKLEVWSKQSKRYETTWIGRDFVRAQIMAAKPYNNHDWQGKKRIVSIKTSIELELRHVNQLITK